ncbi:MAG: M1 family aminopeptidase [Actinomycetota bacterium]
MGQVRGRRTGRARPRRLVIAAPVLVIAAMVAACGVGEGVEIERSEPIVGAEPSAPDADPPTTERADEPIDTDADPTDEAPATEEDPTDERGDGTPSDTDDDDEAPATTAEPSSADDGRPPRTSAGDPLFPELGSSDLDVQTYAVKLNASDPSGELTGSVEIVTLVDTDVDAIALDADGPEVERVIVDGQGTPFENESGELIIDTSADQVADGEATIVVHYRVTPTVRISAVGLPVGWIVAGDGAYVLNEPDGASTWLPSNDHPSDQAVWTFEITVGADHVASANGQLLSRPDPGTAGRWVWRQLEPMPTYLVHLVVGDYEVVDGGVVTSTDGSEIPLTHLVPSERADRFESAIEGVADRIAFFEERFGPYPLERYGLAFVDGLSGLAMETQGRSLFGAEDFEGLPAGTTQQLLLAHELAHQRFGNAVSPADWDDLWLNESLTTYAHWLWLDEIGLQPLEAWAEQMLDVRATRPGDATGAPTVTNLFGFERYDGGAVVVHALRREIGDDAYFELMRTWIDEKVGTSQTTEAFIELAERVHGFPLDDFFDTWLFAAALPDTYPN